jgi:hypothetical protein
LRKGKKVVSVYWRIFLFVKFRNQGKRETQKKDIRKMKNSYGLVEDFVCVRETMGKRRKKADKSI